MEIIEKDVLTKPKFEKGSKGGLMVVLKDKNNVIKQIDRDYFTEE